MEQKLTKKGKQKGDRDISTKHKLFVSSKTATSGITLVALVVTIVVLLILAGITINTILGDNGIITKAQQAKEATIRSNTVSEIQTEILIAQMDGDITQETLERILSKYGDIETEKLDDSTSKITGLKVEGLPASIPIEEIYNGALGDTQSVTVSDIVATENKSEYYGKTVKYEVKSDFKINDTTSLKDFLKSENIEWKIFYADNEHIYLIASDYIPYEAVPNSTSGGTKTSRKPNRGSTSYARSAYFSDILTDYAGSASITGAKLKKLNESYFNSYSSTNNNMKSVAYMMDMKAWEGFAGEKAEYAIGGPSLEMFFNSYNQYHPELKNAGKDKYQSKALNETGYQISYDYGANWKNYIENSADYLKTDNSLYVINSTSNAAAMWLASPSAGNADGVMYVLSSGSVSNSIYSLSYLGFRPLVSLKSDVRLEPGTASYGADFVIK